MPATKNLTIAALLAVTVSVAGCNSNKASSSDSGTAATTAAAAPAASAPDSGASAPAPATGAGAAASAGCVLTAAQATSVMGETFGVPQNSNGICGYTGTTDEFSIDVENASGLHTFDAALAAAKRSQQTDTATPIPGLGDKAAFVQFEIVVTAGGKTIVIRGDSSLGNDSPKLIALAKLVIADLH